LFIDVGNAAPDGANVFLCRMKMNGKNTGMFDAELTNNEVSRENFGLIR
jgi:hypothetical protein